MRENIIGVPMPVCNEKQVRENYRRLTILLIEKGLTITTMESATGGQIASLITDTAGSSAVMKGAFVTYCNEAKIMQGVPGDIIEKYSVYSKETAAAMAKACQAAYRGDICVGVTGTMGNIDPANKNNSTLGQVYFALIVGDELETYQVKIPPQPTRLLYKMYVSDIICGKILDKIS